MFSFSAIESTVENWFHKASDALAPLLSGAHDIVAKLNLTSANVAKIAVTIKSVEAEFGKSEKGLVKASHVADQLSVLTGPDVLPPEAQNYIGLAISAVHTALAIEAQIAAASAK